MRRKKERPEKTKQRFMLKKINKQLISVLGTTLILLGNYIPMEVLANEGTTDISVESTDGATLQGTSTLPTASSDTNTLTNDAPQTTPADTTDSIEGATPTSNESTESTDSQQITNPQLVKKRTQKNEQVQTFFNPTAEDWGYVDKGNYVEITSYTGSWANITVPAKIIGKPVAIDLNTVLGEEMRERRTTETFTIESSDEKETPVRLTGTFNKLFAWPRQSGWYVNNILKSVEFGNADISEIRDMSNMFSSCKKLESIDMSGFDTTNVTNMSSMFYSCSELQSLDVSGFDTTNVNDMSGMFTSCSGLQSLNVSGFDTTNVNDMSDMFYSCSSLQSLDVSGFITTNVTNMSGMFTSCSGLQSLDVSGFDTTNVNGMTMMFDFCSSLQSLDMSGFDTTNVSNMRNMFNSCNRLQDLKLSQKFKFGNNHGLRQLPSGETRTTNHWVKDDYVHSYDSTGNLVAAHNDLPANETVHKYTIQKKVEVTFDTIGGSGTVPTTQHVFAGKCAADPNYTGTNGKQVFENWTLNSQPFTFDTPITEPTDLVASWRATRFSVQFLPNEGTGEMPDQTVEVDESTTLSPNAFSRKGYIFNGWNTKADGDGTPYKDKALVQDLAIEDGAVIKLHAQWKAENYTVIFNSNGGTEVESANYTIEKGIDSFDSPTKKGYEFQGWYEGDNQVNKIATGETGNRRLTAKWKEETYTVKFDSNGGTEVESANYTIEKGIDSFDKPEKKDYEFLGWFDGETSVTEIKTGETGDRTLIAKWKAEEYKVTFDSNGGTEVESVNYTIEKGIDSFNPSTRKGYEFLGWYEGDNQVNEIATGKTGNRTLIAKWKAEKYKVTFDSNGGTKVESVNYTIEKGIDSLNPSTRKGYKFLGWFDDEKQVTEISVGETGDQTLSAKWEKNIYKVTFIDESQQAPKSITYTISDTEISLPDMPERTGYRFLGWLVSDEKMSRSNTNNVVRSLAAGTIGHLRLTAQYEAVEYKMNFDSAGGEMVSPQTFTIESTIDKLPTTKRTGYRFLGWYDGDAKVESISKGTIGDRTLTAKWKQETIGTIEETIKEETEKNRKKEDYTEESWGNYVEAKKQAEELLKQTTPDPAKAEEVLQNLQAAIKGLTLKSAGTPTPVNSAKTYPSQNVTTTPTSVSAKSYPRTNVVSSEWLSVLGTGFVSVAVFLKRRKKK